MPRRIGDDGGRCLGPQPPRALRVAAACGHLQRCAASTTMRWGIASSARLAAGPRRSQRGLREYADGHLAWRRRRCISSLTLRGPHLIIGSCLGRLLAVRAVQAPEGILHQLLTGEWS